MSEAREVILERIRRALHDVPAGEQPAEVPVLRAYRRESRQHSTTALDRLEQRLRDYDAHPRRVAPDEVAGAVGAISRELGLSTLVVPPELPHEWRPPHVELLEDHGLSPGELDRLAGALTGCAAAIAETGTIVLDGQGSSGRRAITLVPDHHICVITADQVLGGVPEGLARVAPSVIRHRRPITLISGPSATSDIELVRVSGVHGPRHLHVVIVEDQAPNRPR